LPVDTDQRGEALVEINFRILGQSALRIGDRFEIGWAQPKPRGLLSVLLLQPRRDVPVGELIDWMWPDGKAPRDPAGTLYTYKKRIVAALDRMDTPPKIHGRDRSYRLEADREEIDFHEFSRRADRARWATRQGDHAGACQTLAAAVDELWLGTPLPDLQGERAENWRRMAENEHLLPAYALMLQGLCALGEYNEVLRRLADLRLEHQADLTMVGRRITALYGLHRNDEATAYFLAQHKRLRSAGDQDAADELKRFHDESRLHVRDRQVAVRRMPAKPVPRLLPHDIPEFTGREDLLRYLDTVTTTADDRPAAMIAALTGQAGVGKTALAVRWAHQAEDRFPGGQLHMDLRGFAGGPRVEESEVVAEFLTALGCAPDGIPTPAERAKKLRSLLGGGPRALVVLDNVADAQHIPGLLDCLTNCTVLITSRRRLPGLARRGAAVVPVLPLTYAEGKAWLTKWLGPRAVAEAGAVSDLAAMCGGIALALRIVADHILIRPGVALTEFVDELSDEKTLLDLGDHDGPDHSVRAALSWSYRVLGEAEQRLFRLLGVHPGPDISLAAAAALLGDDRRTVKRSLDILVDANLVGQPESRERYRFHDLLRRYARELVATSDERAAAARRLVSFYLFTAHNADQLIVPNGMRVTLPELVAGVEPIEFGGQEAALKWAARERANINAIIRYAAANELHEYASKLPSLIGEVFQQLGYRVDVATAMRMAIESARMVGDVYDEASWHGNLAHIQIDLRDFESADQNIAAGKMLFARIGDEFGIALMDHRLGRLLFERGETRRSIEVQLTALSAFQRLDMKVNEVKALYCVSQAYHRAGNLDAAASFGQDALWNAERINDTHMKGRVFAELAAIHLERGSLPAAKGYCHRALELHENVAPGESGKVFTTLAGVHLQEGDIRTAEVCARRALTYCRGASDSRGQAQALRIIAELLYKQARHDEAVENWTLALSLLESVNDPHSVTAVRNRLNEVVQTNPFIPADRTEPMDSRQQARITR
jgi:tetratricopeptide (TPR) repeat protein/DNA-binding SARP family transcriptional activator